MTDPDDVCAIVLAAGLGTRLRPLTGLRPKALVPVGNVPLLDQALDRLAAVGLSGVHRVAVNAHYLADQIVSHVAGRAHLSHEDEPLGTAGAVGRLRRWVDGRAVLVVNADSYVDAEPGDLRDLLDDWDGRTVRMHGVPGKDASKFAGLDFAGASLLPGVDAHELLPEYSHLVLTTWRPAERAGRLEVVELDGTFIDCGTPASYLEANLHACRGDNLLGRDVLLTGAVHSSVIGDRSQVLGEVRSSVLWEEAHVDAGEVLVNAIRVGRDLTVEATDE